MKIASDHMWIVFGAIISVAGLSDAAQSAESEAYLVGGCPGAHALADHPEPEWMTDFLRLPWERKESKWLALSTYQQVELALLVDLLTCHTLDNGHWAFRAVSNWPQSLPVLRSMLTVERSDRVVMQIARLLSEISSFKHDLRSDEALLRDLDNRVKRIRDSTTRWYAAEYVSHIRERRSALSGSAHDKDR